MRRIRILVPRWPGLRHCILSPWSQHAARSVVDRNVSTSTVQDDKPPSPICYRDLARMVEEARRPLKVRGQRNIEFFRSAYNYWYRSTLRGWSVTLASVARQRDERKGRRSNIDAQHLLDLVLEQGGLCAYSSIPMELLKPNSHWRMSVERKDNRQGYVQGNCCLIAAEFNSRAQWSKQKVKEVARVRTKEVQLQRLQEDIAVARVRPSPSRTITSQKLQGPDTEGRWPCTCCGIWKHMSQFPKCSKSRGGFQRQCKQCTGDKQSAWRQTMRGHGQALLANARYRSSTAHTWSGSFTLDMDDVLDMLWLQGGRCYYSGILLHCGAGPADWVWSIERLDNSVTYNKENCVLIAQEFQTADNSRNKAKFPVFGTAQWSRSKVSHVWGPHYSEC